MLDSRRPSSLLTVSLLAAAAALSACAPRSLLVVQPCSDGGAIPCPATPNVPLAVGLVGLWHLNEAPGSTMAQDSSGNGNHGILKELDPATAWVAGHEGDGGGLRIGGTGYVEVPMPSPSIAAISNGVTVAAWISLEGDVKEYGTAISRQIGNSIDQYYHLSVNATERPALFVAMDELPSPVAFVPGDAAVKRATFTHIAGTYDGSVARLYVDGEQKASDEIRGLFKSDTTPLILGANGNGPIVDERFPGRIDEIVLYNRPLDSKEIAQVAAGALSSYMRTHPPDSTADGGAHDR